MWLGSLLKSGNLTACHVRVEDQLEVVEMKINKLDADAVKEGFPESAGLGLLTAEILESVVDGFEPGFIEAKNGDLEILLWNQAIPSIDESGNQESLLIRLSLMDCIKRSADPIHDEESGPRLAEILRRIADHVETM